MGYVIIIRNPSNKKLLAVTEEDGDAVAEFSSESEANDAAHETTVCRAWGFEVVEIGL